MAKTNADQLYSQLDQFIADDSNQPKRLTSGEIVEGTVVDIRPGAIIVDVGYKSEGIVAGRELKSDMIDVNSLKEGDTLLVYVVRPEDEEGQLILSVRRTQQAGVWLELEEAKTNNDVVEATVVESNNGGVIVQLKGDVRGFIPTSQLDAQRVYVNGVRQVGKDISAKVQKKLTSLVGETIKTRIIELDREKNRIILSEKMVTQERDLERREKTLKSVKEGDVLKGEVSGITPFGIFVNAQGLEGLVHLSELSWDKVENIESLYKVGDTVQVMVIGITDGGKRVAYSVKRLLTDPWSELIAKYKVGDVVDGEVQKVVDFGAFVRIDEGLNGLVHISEMSDKLVRDPRDIVSQGDKVKVKILSISSTERHLGLSLKWDSETKKSKISSDDTSSETVDSAELAEKVEEALKEENPSD
ncbi:MAG: S1 RNA-binding domain-containing protein [Candidatus Dojkabacteria bacterium]|nr:MAG: S1 RNA-binding domain-containing protein [Candidatus Dojkabacteria bacterium]